MIDSRRFVSGTLAMNAFRFCSAQREGFRCLYDILFGILLFFPGFAAAFLNLVILRRKSRIRYLSVVKRNKQKTGIQSLQTTSFDG